VRMKIAVKYFLNFNHYILEFAAERNYLLAHLSTARTIKIIERECTPSKEKRDTVLLFNLRD
jgi:hypothetical protein